MIYDKTIKNVHNVWHTPSNTCRTISGTSFSQKHKNYAKRRGAGGAAKVGCTVGIGV